MTAAISTSERVTCAYCGRVVATEYGWYVKHSIEAGGRQSCPLASMPVVPTPVDGVWPTEEDLAVRARLVPRLGQMQQDEDPHLVWTYLSTLKPMDLQIMLAAALAIVPTEGRIRDIFAWLYELPDSKLRAVS